MMKALEQTASHTSNIIRELVLLMNEVKHLIRKELPKIYSHELINNLFKYPYTKIEYIINDLGLHRNTARKYLDQLISIGLLDKHKKGKENYYLNKKLFDLLTK